MIYSLYSIILRNSNALRDLRWHYPREEFILYNIREIDNTFVLSWRWRIIHHFLLLYSWEGKLPQLRSWSRAIGNLIRRLRCTARTVKSDGICITRDAMRSPFAYLGWESTGEILREGGPWDLQSYFIREREELHRSTFARSSNADCQ